MNVRIFKTAKNAMQSGRAKTGVWVLEYERPTPRRPEPLMGWSSSGDTSNQVRIYFDSEEEAIAFAGKQGWVYDVQAPHLKRIKPRNYADNFRYISPKLPDATMTDVRKVVDKTARVKEKEKP